MSILQASTLALYQAPLKERFQTLLRVPEAPGKFSRTPAASFQTLRPDPSGHRAVWQSSTHPNPRHCSGEPFGRQLPRGSAPNPRARPQQPCSETPPRGPAQGPMAPPQRPGTKPQGSDLGPRPRPRPNGPSRGPAPKQPSLLAGRGHSSLQCAPTRVWAPAWDLDRVSTVHRSPCHQVPCPVVRLSGLSGLASHYSQGS